MATAIYFPTSSDESYGSDCTQLTVCRVAHNHLVAGLKALERQVRDLVGFVRALCRRDDRRITNERVVDAGVRNQVGLEFVQVHIQRPAKAKRRGYGRYDLGDQLVEVLIRWTSNVEVPPANIVDGLVVDQEGAIRVLDGAMGRQDGIVGLDNGRADLRSRIDCKLELRLFAVILRKTLEKECTEARAGAASERVEDQEALQAGAVVGNTADTLDNGIGQLLPDSVVASGIVVRRIFFTANQQFGVEEVPIGTGSDLIDGLVVRQHPARFRRTKRTHRGIQVDKDGARNEFALSTSSGEECFIRSTLGSIGDLFLIDSSVLLQAVLQQVPRCRLERARKKSKRDGSSTVPTQRCRAGYQLDRCVDGRSENPG